MPIRSRYGWYRLEGVTPDYSQPRWFWVANDYVEWLNASRQSDKARAAILLEPCLKTPTSTFRGLKRPDDVPPYSEGLIYCGKPEYYFPRDGPAEEFPKDYVLAVYVIFNEMESRFEVIDWDLREEDRDFPGHPLSWQTDFGGRIWPPS